MAKCKLIVGQTPYTADGCATSDVFAVNTHYQGLKGNTLAEIAYRKELSDYILSCGEGPGSFTKIMQLFKSSPVKVKAKEFYQRSMSEINFNVYAANTTTGGIGLNATVIFNAKSHLNGGSASLVNQGYTLINLRNGQVYEVVGQPNKSVNYAHSAVVRSLANEAVEIRQGDPMGVFATRFIGDVACSTLPSIQLRDMGFTTFTTPIRYETSWCMNHGAGIQNEVYLLDMIDNAGKKFRTWDPVIRSNKRREMDIFRTMMWFFGTKVSNTNISTVGNFAGWNGYLYNLRFGGGNYHGISMSGITIVQLDMVESRAQAYPSIKEFMWYLPYDQRNNLESNLNPLFASSAGACTFDTFRRSGEPDAERNGTMVKQLGVKSLARNGFTHHFVTASWATESNGLGVGILRDAIFAFPSVGATDIEGNVVPTFETLEFDNNEMHHYKYEETIDNMQPRAPDFCEKTMGVIRDTMWIKTNCLTNHWQFQPSWNC